MVMFGGGQWSGGFKIFKSLIKSLKGRKAQVVMINGRDGKSFRRVQKMKFESGIKVFNVGFTENVPLYLSAADIILNKFGGTSVAEMLNKSIPMLITENLPAQEECNLNYMKEKGGRAVVQKPKRTESKSYSAYGQSRTSRRNVKEYASVSEECMNESCGIHTFTAERGLQQDFRCGQRRSFRSQK